MECAQQNVQQNVQQILDVMNPLNWVDSRGAYYAAHPWGDYSIRRDGRDPRKWVVWQTGGLTPIAVVSIANYPSQEAAIERAKEIARADFADRLAKVITLAR